MKTIWNLFLIAAAVAVVASFILEYYGRKLTGTIGLVCRECMTPVSENQITCHKCEHRISKDTVISIRDMSAKTGALIGAIIFGIELFIYFKYFL